MSPTRSENTGCVKQPSTILVLFGALSLDMAGLLASCPPFVLASFRGLVTLGRVATHRYYTYHTHTTHLSTTVACLTILAWLTCFVLACRSLDLDALDGTERFEFEVPDWQVSHLEKPDQTAIQTQQVSHSHSLTHSLIRNH